MIRKIYYGLKSLDEYAQLVLSYYSENKEIKKTLKTLPQPKLTSKEKKEIDSYWEQYGIRFKNYDWFQWYYGFTGIKSPMFIPKQIHDKIISEYYNERSGFAFSFAFSDKNLFYNILPEANFPVPILRNIDGAFYDRFDRYICGSADLTEFLTAEQGEIIVKKAIGGYQGKSVKKYLISGKPDAQKLLDDWKGKFNYIVQKAVRQHPFFARFNESSVNVMRINSLCINGKVMIHTPILRFGYPGWVTDVSFIDGLEDVRAVGITEDGYLMDDVISLQGKRWKLKDVITDPDNKKIPCWEEIVAMIEQNAPKLKHIGKIGWDITVSEDGKPVVVEYNIGYPAGGYPGSALPQLAAGPLFGSQTDTVLEFLKDKRNQKKYIPHWLRF